MHNYVHFLHRPLVREGQEMVGRPHALPSQGAVLPPARLTRSTHKSDRLKRGDLNASRGGPAAGPGRHFGFRHGAQGFQRGRRCAWAGRQPSATAAAAGCDLA